MHIYVLKCGNCKILKTFCKENLPVNKYIYMRGDMYTVICNIYIYEYIIVKKGSLKTLGYTCNDVFML